MTAGLPLMQYVLTLTPLAKSVLIPLGVTAAISVTDAAIQKKIYESGAIASIISNEEMEYVMKILKSLEELGLLIKKIVDQVKMKQKDKKTDFPESF